MPTTGTSLQYQRIVLLAVATGLPGVAIAGADVVAKWHVTAGAVVTAAGLGARRPTA